MPVRGRSVLIVRVASRQDCSSLCRVIGDVTVTGCWFHVTQSIIKRVHKLGLKDEYVSDPDVQDIVRCLLGLPLLPADKICLAFDEVKLVVSNDSRFVNKLNDLLRYAGRHRTQKRSISLARLCAVITGTEQTTSWKASMLHSAVESKYPIRTSSYSWDTCNTLRRSTCTTWLG